MDSNSIPRTERYSLTLRQLVQWGCQKTLIGGDIAFTSARNWMRHKTCGLCFDLLRDLLCDFEVYRLVAQAAICRELVAAAWIVSVSRG